MSTTETTTIVRGVKHRCPLCGEADSLRLLLADVHSIECGECGDDLSLDDVRKTIAAWQSLLTWLDTAPVIDPED